MSLGPFHRFVLEHPEKDVHVCLRGAQPWAGKISVAIETVTVQSDKARTYDQTIDVPVYCIVSEAQIGRQVAKIPFYFQAADVLWWSTGPDAAVAERPRIDLAGSWPST